MTVQFSVAAVSRRRVVGAAAALLALLAVAACDSSADSSKDAVTPKAETKPAVSIKDPWVKAAPKGMTAAFGTLRNDGDQPVTVISATSAAAPKLELHEVAMAGGKMVMRPKTGGFTIPARGTHELAPGGDHIMFMELAAAVKPGDEVAVTLKLKDGTELTFTAPAKEIAGGKEDYQPGGMDMNGKSS